ncbi:hypothetical protein MKW98_022366 [Papaver atlanticum]|uniref:Uncharacterized protein n=1 Tax=Papaver atlanticum TaxID=357466 RepID=A0AAD4XIE0_9MAGN|nr:hypothetical protein MKW98_022366 [Papaver atlanticum]
MTYIRVASIYEENGVSGFRYIIRDCHGTPMVSYFEYVDTNEIGPVSEFYPRDEGCGQKFRTCRKTYIKYVTMVSTSCEVAFAVHDCYVGEICRERINGKPDDKVIDVSVRIIEKLSRRRHRDPQENHIYFHIFPNEDERSLNSAACLVGLEASGRESKLEFLFYEGLQKMPLGSGFVELMKHLHEDVSYESVFHP